MPKVSVIIPVYNVEKYLRECLDSVVNQTLKDIEIICINDGSTDGSLKILEEYAKRDERIIVINQQNQGVAKARNIGLEKAKGQYLSILDSDDYFEQTMLEMLFEKAVNDDMDIVICRCKVLDSKHNSIKSAEWTINDEFLADKPVFSAKDIPDTIFNFCIGWAWDKFYKTEFVRQYKLSFPELDNSEDVPFVFSSLILANRVCIMQEIFVTHRLKLKNQRSGFVFKDCNDAFVAIDMLKQFLEERGAYSIYEKSFLNWVLDFCYWIIKSSNITTFCKSIKKVRKDLFYNLNLYSKNRNYFYNNASYSALFKKLFSESFLCNTKFVLKHWMFYFS